MLGTHAVITPPHGPSIYLLRLYGLRRGWEEHLVETKETQKIAGADIPVGTKWTGHGDNTR